MPHRGFNQIEVRVNLRKSVAEGRRATAKIQLEKKKTHIHSVLMWHLHEPICISSIYMRLKNVRRVHFTQIHTGKRIRCDFERKRIFNGIMTWMHYSKYTHTQKHSFHDLILLDDFRAVFLFRARVCLESLYLCNLISFLCFLQRQFLGKYIFNN